jgi:N-acetyl-gamma-glutamyl-phosphate reductase
MNPVKVGIVGASGYSGEELVRLLLRHPGVELAAVTSRQYAGQTVAQVFPKFAHHPHAQNLRFSEPKSDLLAQAARIIFLALPHGVAAEFAAPLLGLSCRVIDLSADFRLKNPATYQEFYGQAHPAPELLKKSVYGLPELHRAMIENASLIAAPGCYPTGILLPLIPLLQARLVQPHNIIAASLSGVSGAGRKLEVDYLFVECHESARAYAPLRHRHLSEIEEQLSAAAGSAVVIQFTPHLIPVNRGLLTTLYLTPEKPFAGESEMESLGRQIAECYQTAYGGEPFVRLLDAKSLPDTKNVTGTNVIEIAWRLDPRTGRLLVLSALDNLTKGASGQAVQSMNILCGFPETAGLV